MADAIKHLKWLPIKEIKEFSISKLVFLALNDRTGLNTYQLRPWKIVDL